MGAQALGRWPLMLTKTLGPSVHIKDQAPGQEFCKSYSITFVKPPGVIVPSHPFHHSANIC